LSTPVINKFLDLLSEVFYRSVQHQTCCKLTQLATIQIWKFLAESIFSGDQNTSFLSTKKPRNREAVGDAVEVVKDAM
jgi:hypothetical protein